MGRTIIGMACGFALGFGVAFLALGRSQAEEPRTEEELADVQQRAQEKADRAERQMQKETRKRPAYVRE